VTRKKSAKDIVKQTARMWKIKETGYKYTKKIRSEWGHRAKATKKPYD
jgi:hypothetical protein